LSRASPGLAATPPELKSNPSKGAADQKGLLKRGCRRRRSGRRVKAEDGSRTSVEVETAVRQWWWQQDNGKLALSIRYGSKVIALSAKSNAVECANYDELTAALATIRTAVEAGELDAQIETASTKLRDGFRK
jgi:hypothetical protein